MNTRANLLYPAIATGFAGTRAARLYDELDFALGSIETATTKAWGKRAGFRLLLLAGRRVGGLARLVAVLARSGGGELFGLLVASHQRRLSIHIGDRTAAAIDGTLAIGRDGARLIVSIARAVTSKPKENAPAVLGALLGFSVGSGGLDANGGIPDLDLLAGIGAHRSALTHTLIAGIVAEGLLLALVDLAAEVHDRLPNNHDPIWDDLARIGRPLAENLAIGTSAGLAYHLLVDALVQPAALHGLPMSMSLEGHQGVIAASGLAEGSDAVARTRSRHDAVKVMYAGPAATTTGRKVVNAVSQTAASMTDVVAESLKSALSRWK